jgi:Fe-S-cluster-containing hydrogenase component 2
MSSNAPPVEPRIWIDRDYPNCSGCRLCEIACSLKHEGRIWPEASRVRVFMLVPGVEVPHLCVQCYDYPCVAACPFEALSADEATGAVRVDAEACTACGVCIDACPGRVPHLHPNGEHIVICDLCGGDPECVRVCQGAGFNTLKAITPRSVGDTERIACRTPEELTEDLALLFYGDTAEEVI